MKSFTERRDQGQSWLEAGEGAPLVLVHGIGGSAATWLPVMDALARHHHVYAWNFPGYGGAAPLPGDAPPATDYARALLAFLDQRGISAAHVVGHSLGAVVVAALAQAAAARVSRLSLICPVIGAGHLPADAREQMRLARRDEILAGGMGAFAQARTASIIGPQASQEDVAGIIETMAGIAQPAYLQAWEMLCAAQIVPLLDPALAPALVVGGDVDPVAPPQAVTQVAQALSVTPHILPSVGHFPTHEATEELVALICQHD